MYRGSSRALFVVATCSLTNLVSLIVVGRVVTLWGIKWKEGGGRVWRGGEEGHREGRSNGGGRRGGNGWRGFEGELNDGGCGSLVWLGKGKGWRVEWGKGWREGEVWLDWWIVVI